MHWLLGGNIFIAMQLISSFWQSKRYNSCRNAIFHRNSLDIISTASQILLAYDD